MAMKVTCWTDSKTYLYDDGTSTTYACMENSDGSVTETLYTKNANGRINQRISAEYKTQEDFGKAVSNMQSLDDYAKAAKSGDAKYEGYTSAYMYASQNVTVITNQADGSFTRETYGDDNKKSDDSTSDDSSNNNSDDNDSSSSGSSGDDDDDDDNDDNSSGSGDSEDEGGGKPSNIDGDNKDAKMAAASYEEFLQIVQDKRNQRTNTGENDAATLRDEKMSRVTYESFLEQIQVRIDSIINAGEKGKIKKEIYISPQDAADYFRGIIGQFVNWGENGAPVVVFNPNEEDLTNIIQISIAKKMNVSVDAVKTAYFGKQQKGQGQHFAPITKKGTSAKVSTLKKEADLLKNTAIKLTTDANLLGRASLLCVGVPQNVVEQTFGKPEKVSFQGTTKRVGVKTPTDRRNSLSKIITR